MIAYHAPFETIDTRLAAMHHEIAILEATCKKGGKEARLSALKQRLYFLQWKRENLAVVYDRKVEQV